MTTIYAVYNRIASPPRYLLTLAFLSVLFLAAGCRSERQSMLPTPDLDVLVQTATPLTVRIELVVMAVTPTAEPTAEAPAAPEADSQSETAPAQQPSSTAEAAQSAPPESVQAASMSSEELVTMGEDLYARNCASCHQNNGEGTSSYPALNNSAMLTAEDPTQSIQLVLYGRGEMPAFEDTLSTQQVAAVLSYERNSWSNNASTVTVEQVRQVRQGGSAVAANQEGAAPAEQAEATPTEQPAAQAEQAEDAPTEQPAAAQDEPVDATPTEQPTAQAEQAEATPTQQTAVAAAAPVEADAEALIEQGNTVYATECASCHQLSGEGTNSYPALNNSPMLTAEDPTGAIEIVLHGRGEMPAFAGLLSNEEIAAVLSHERNAWDNNASVVTAAQVEQVQQGGAASAENQDDSQPATATVTATQSSSVTATSTMTATVAATSEVTATATMTTTGQLTTTATMTTTSSSTGNATPSPAQEGASIGATPPMTWTPARAVTPLLPATVQAAPSVTSAAAITASVTSTTTATPPPQSVAPSADATATVSMTVTAAPADAEAAATPTAAPATAPANSSAGGDAEAMIAQGEEIYASNCASCHQVSGEGNSQYPALNNGELLTAEDAADAIRIVLHGQGEMPSFEGLLSNEEIAAVLSYGRNAWDNNASTVSVAEVEQVQTSSASAAEGE